MSTTRRRAAILAADVAEYSAAMGRDEEGTFAAFRALRRDVIEPRLAEHQGRLINTTAAGCPTDTITGAGHEHVRNALTGARSDRRKQCLA